MKIELVKEQQLTFYSEEVESVVTPQTTSCLIESEAFPFEHLSLISAYESHRKDIYRPIYHIHKWWAQRLGSVFRGIIIGATIESDKSLIDAFYDSFRRPGVKVFDPFMGSGTTLGEAHKLGCIALGRDINRVAFNNVKISLSKIEKSVIEKEFKNLEETVGKEIKALYSAVDSEGNACEVLYYFWVKVLPCPTCSHDTDLFSSYVFSRNAYVKKNPRTQVYCPECHDIFESTYGEDIETCKSCSYSFNPSDGPAKKAIAVCSSCHSEFQIAKVAKSQGRPPSHRMYAKLVLRQDGKKEYLRITQDDLDSYNSVSRKLQRLQDELPTSTISNGHNTKQVLNYGYTKWVEFFNDRQLFSLLTLSKGINAIVDVKSKETLKLLFTAILDFNNMFASFKGEGTGAVRHMFSHHILKPERTPLEANLWGTPKSSGSFSTLFKTRIGRAIDYQKSPFEVRPGTVENKIFNLSVPFTKAVSTSWPPKSYESSTMYISCGSSSETKLPDKSVDLVVTDPPFFDNVHYSELADFFHIWQELVFNNEKGGDITTRSIKEVQDVDASAFAKKLESVFSECYRILTSKGLMAFTYHHSRKEGWTSLISAVKGSGFNFVQAHPVKSEMSVATPKLQAKSPIDYDIILVCKKTEDDPREIMEFNIAVERAKSHSRSKILRLRSVNLPISESDVRIIVLSEILTALSPCRTLPELLSDFIKAEATIQGFITELFLKFN